MNDKYFEVHIPFNSTNYAELETMLAVHGNIAWLEEEGAFIICFPVKSEAQKFIQYIENEVKEPMSGISIRELSNKDWNKEWEKTVKPVKIGKKLVVYPSWLKDDLEDTEGKILIEIDPKMAFGTGHNETTQIMLELMTKYVSGEEESLLDFGCGTGILAIAGVKLGVDHAVAIDTDPEAVTNARECISRNDTESRIEILCAGIDEIEHGSFDMICANIISSVILENIEHISDKAVKGAKLFLSGILISEDQEILNYLFTYDFDVEDIVSKGEWMGIYAVKR